jgi:hypothetical protein
MEPNKAKSKRGKAKPKRANLSYYVVLNDGDTFTSLGGCKLVIVNEDKLTEDEKELLDDGCMRDYLEEFVDSAQVTDLYSLLQPS